jgi:histone acetyltransferase HTATIP
MASLQVPPSAGEMQPIPVGSKLLVQKSEGNLQKAQVLATKPHMTHGLSLYVHYDGFNKRLDEWIPYSLVKLDSIELPKLSSKSSGGSGSNVGQSPSVKASSSSSMKRKKGPKSVLALGKGKAQKQLQQEQQQSKQPKASKAGSGSAKENTLPGSAETSDNDDQSSTHDKGPELQEQPGFSKEKELEKLRTSGSMTQSHAEIARVKNIEKIQFGKHEIEAW